MGLAEQVRTRATPVDRLAYDRCVAASEQVAWTVEEVIAGRTFDLSVPLLPEALARTRDVPSLSEADRLMLNHIRANSYMHLFAFFEEIVPPLLSRLAGDDLHGGKARLRGLLRFADEEFKHQALFERAQLSLSAELRAPCQRISGAADVARIVNQNEPLAVVLVVGLFEWMTQTHYVQFVQENKTERLDPLFGHILRAHWVEEAQHAKIDALEVAALVQTLTPAARDSAVAQFFELGGAVLNLVADQMRLDVETLECAIERRFEKEEKQQLILQQTRAGHDAFVGMGLRHPNFLAILEDVSSEARTKAEAIGAQLIY